jgi:hypothetical protein
MTTAELLTDLIARGIEFQAHGDKLRFRPAERLTPIDIDNIRRHKPTMLAMLRAEGFICLNPNANPRPLDVCDRCGSLEYYDISIHEGRSLRRECIHCRRFMGWPRWYGHALSEKGDTETRHED